MSCMIPSTNSMIFKKTGEKKVLTLMLSEGENIHDSIKQGMKENSIEKATIEEMNGILSSASVNYMLGSHYKSQEFENIPVLKAFGKYELQGETLWGNLHIVVPMPKPTNVTLLKGTAKDNLEIKISFVQI